MTQEQKEPTFKRLKITNHNGDVNYIPLNKMNKRYHEERLRKVSFEKRAKCKIEEVELSLDEAVELGVSEAIQIKTPPRKRKQAADTEMLTMMLQQQMQLNQQLSERLARLEAANDAPKPKREAKS
jgi:hypothetical protein